MSCSLTRYRRPIPRYGRADSGWRPASGWELVGGKWHRVWHRGRACRRATVWRPAGLWMWEVSEWRKRGGWVVVARAAAAGGREPYFTAQAAMPFADLAARTK